MQEIIKNKLEEVNKAIIEGELMNEFLENDKKASEDKEYKNQCTLKIGSNKENIKLNERWKAFLESKLD